MTESIQLTRYLYIKEDVLMSLCISILEKDYDQSLFWASELYFSGYEKITIEYIHAIYTNLFYSNNPKLKKIMDVGLQRFDKGIHIAASMLLNLTSNARTFTLQDFIMKNKEPEFIPNAKERETKLYIFSNIDEANKYNNDIDDIDPRFILKKNCIYKVRREWIDVFECCHQDIDINELCKMHRGNWLYYASYSPIWKNRIEQYHGAIDIDNKTINFENDDYFEEFYENFEYDLDEQSNEVQTKIFGTSILKRFNINEFYKTYEPNIKIKKIIKIKKNK